MFAAWIVICIYSSRVMLLSHRATKWWITIIWTRTDEREDVIRFLPVMYICDCRRPVAKDPRLDVHWLCFGVRYGHIYYPLQAFIFINCHERKGKKRTQDMTGRQIKAQLKFIQGFIIVLRVTVHSLLVQTDSKYNYSFRQKYFQTYISRVSHFVLIYL